MSVTLWIIIAVVFALIELFTPSFFSLSLTVGCLIAALMTWIGLDLIYQLIGLAIGTAVFLIFIRPLLCKKNDKTEFGYQGMVGKKGHVIKLLSNNEYEVKVDGQIWKAEADKELHENQIVIIEEVRGVTLIVKGE